MVIREMVERYMKHVKLAAQPGARIGETPNDGLQSHHSA
jgi:hypothetical protein